MVAIIAACSKCQHYRERPKAQLFTASMLQNPGISKHELEWEQQEDQRRLMEMQRFQGGQPFTYEPYYYPWCDGFTPFDALLPSTMEKFAVDDQGSARKLAEDSHKRMLELIEKAKSGNSEALQELMKRRGGTMNPVTGDIEQVYALCARMNPTGQCPVFEPHTTGAGI